MSGSEQIALNGFETWLLSWSWTAGYGFGST
jgi:hypothetical protein